MEPGGIKAGRVIAVRKSMVGEEGSVLLEVSIGGWS